MTHLLYNCLVRPSLEIAKSCRESIESSQVGKCYQEYGFVLSTGWDIKVLEKKILSSGRLLCRVVIDCDTFLPQREQEFEEKPERINEHGIHFLTKGVMKTSIVRRDLEGFEYNEEKNKYVASHRVIGSESFVRYKLLEVRFQKKRYCAVALLLE